MGQLFVAVCRLLIAGASCCGARPLGARASVVVARGLSSCGSRALERRFSSCGTRAQLLCGMWDLPGPGLKPVSPALAGRFLITSPPGKPWKFLKKLNTHLPNDLAIPLLGIYPRKMKAYDIQCLAQKSL